jgi:hypothetical protein
LCNWWLCEMYLLRFIENQLMVNFWTGQIGDAISRLVISCIIYSFYGLCMWGPIFWMINPKPLYTRAWFESSSLQFSGFWFWRYFGTWCLNPKLKLLRAWLVFNLNSLSKCNLAML